MRKLILSLITPCFFIVAGHAQTLFTYGGTPVSKEQFIKVYEKNSISKQPDFSAPALRDYLSLYELFEMKVAEAEAQHLDTLSSIQRELDTYRQQLARNYLTDDEVNNKLVHEAYNRMKEDVHIEHILILCAPTADSTAARRKIDSIYDAIVYNKADFETMAKDFSQDRGSKANGGDIGYITALETVYPFENAAYNTPVGKVSKPFRTQFGYHILKVIDKRPAKGEIEVAQIMLATPKSKGEEGMEIARKRIDSIETALKHGASFEKLVKEYSEDKFSKDNGGVLKRFSVGHMVPAFENAAFALKKPGDISKPVQTEYGFHIIKLIAKYPLQPFDSIKAEIKHKVENDARAQMARDIYLEKVKQKNGFKEYPANLDAFIQNVEVNVPDTGRRAARFSAADYRYMDKPLFSLSGKDYKQNDFATYMAAITRGRLMGRKTVVVHDLYNMYVKTVVNDFEEHKLVEENPEFRSLMEEYRDGIMLFELMDRNVWGKATKDSTGLSEFYEQHKDKYMWEPGFEGSVYKFRDEAAMKEGVKMLHDKENKDEDILKAVNSKNNADNVSIQHGHFEFSRFKDVPQSEIEASRVTKAVKNADGTYTVVKVEKLYRTPTQKSLDEARGYVVAGYQDYLENKWNEQMREKYPVKVNEQVFQSMVKK